jgi:hypothetical protein
MIFPNVLIEHSALKTGVAENVKYFTDLYGREINFSALYSAIPGFEPQF